MCGSSGSRNPAIYQPVLQRLAVDPARVLAVGDALGPDVAGAAAVDLAACWVLGGLHRDSLVGADGSFDTAKAECEANEVGLTPIATIPRFVW